ncbi:MAG: pyridoxal phosphate-dependent aminotransferase [bacterium]
MTPTLAKNILGMKAEGAYAVLSKATKLESAGKNIVHFEIGQPDFPTPQNIVDAGVKAITSGQTKYTSPLGIIPLREALAKRVSDTRHLSLTADNIAVCPSGKTAIFMAMAAVLEPGDEVIYPNPGFPTYQTLIDYLGCVRKPIPLLEENSFSFDMQAFHQSFSAKTKLIIINSPSNPTGGVMPQADLDEITQTIKGKNCWVMTDEMYASITYGNQPYPSFYAIPGVQDQTILVDGFSKTYAMTGWRIGYVAAPPSLIEKVDFLLTHTVGCTATFTQYAALEALTGSQEPVKQMVAEFNSRRDFVVKTLNDIPGVKCPIPEGAFYVFPNIKSFGKTSAEIATYLLETGGVALLPGTSFGEYGEGYLRISYATSMDKLEEGLTRVKNALAKLK